MYNKFTLIYTEVEFSLKVFKNLKFYVYSLQSQCLNSKYSILRSITTLFPEIF